MGESRRSGTGRRLRALLLVSPLLVLSAPARAQDPGETTKAQEPAARPRPVVRSVRVEGNARYTREQLAGAFGQTSGQPLVAETELRRGVQVLFDTFHVRTTVELAPLEGSEEVELVLKVEELALDPELRIIGNVAVNDEKVREWAGLGKREELYLYQAPRIRQRLLQHYRDEGYYFAEVNVVERPAGTDAATGLPTAPDVIFEIKEGPEVKVRDVVLTGNDLLPDGGILFMKHGLSKLAKTELHGPRFLGFFASDLVEDTLQADIVAMREVYRDLGYLDAVVELERLEFSADRRWVTIHIAVDEGPPFTVDSVDIQAVRRVRDEQAQAGYREEPAELIIPEAELVEKLSLHPGTVFERRRIEEDHRALRDLYGARGHVEHASLPVWEGFHFDEPELVFDPVQPKVRVIYHLAQGEPISIREILVQGNVHTQDAVIRRMMTVKPGTLADPKEIERSRARIEATDFFSPDPFHPDIIPPQVRYLDTGDAAVKDLAYVIEEGGVLGFEIAGGISTTQGAFGTIRLRKGNFDITNLPSSFGSSIEEVARLESFHGAGEKLSIEASPGTQVTRYTASFFEPDVFNLYQDYIGLGVDARNTRRIFDSHTEGRRDYSLRLVRQFAADASVYVRYGFGSVDVSNIDTGGEPGVSTPLAVPQDLKNQEGKNALAHLDLGYDYNTVDSRLLPRNGMEINFQASLFDENLGSDFDFLRSQVQIDLYHEFDDDPDLVSDYVHAGFMLGAGMPYGGADRMPYTERWFLGGRQLRGFDFRGVGPNENGFPIGGTTAFYGTLEYRHPLVKNVQPGSYREIEAIQGGFFLDFGLQDPDRFSLDFNELRASYGFLFGISFPVPLTFSFGFPLRSGDGDSSQVFEFDIGF